MFPPWLRWVICLCCSALGVVAAQAAVGINVVFDDPAAAYTAFYDPIRTNVVAAGNEWLALFGMPPAGASLEVEVIFSTTVPTATGASATSSFVRSDGAINVFEQGATAELRTGIDPNGTASDIRFELGVAGYLQDELWFDPMPETQGDAVPSDRTDARSVFLHEFGHAFGFNGFKNDAGQLPGDFESTFDALTVVCADGSALLCFDGPQATRLYGSLVPLTLGTPFHLGNPAPLPGSDLLGDLMNGLDFVEGHRYAISALDRAIMEDIGALPAIPEPSTYALMLAGLFAVAGIGRRWKPRATA